MRPVRSTAWRAPRVPAPEQLLVHLRRARDHIDRHYDEPLDLDEIAPVAGVSKYHFLRCSRRRTARRLPATSLSGASSGPRTCSATNLTVTEVCILVGYSLGRSAAASVSWSAPPRRPTRPGSWPRAFPPIPGCYVFMHGLSDRRPSDSATWEKGSRSDRSWPVRPA